MTGRVACLRMQRDSLALAQRTRVAAGDGRCAKRRQRLLTRLRYVLLAEVPDEAGGYLNAIQLIVSRNVQRRNRIIRQIVGWVTRQQSASIQPQSKVI